MYKVTIRSTDTGTILAEGNAETLGQARFMSKAFDNAFQNVEVTKTVDLTPKTRATKK